MNREVVFSKTTRERSSEIILKWFMLLLIGVVVGVTAVVLDFGVSSTLVLKNKFVLALLRQQGISEVGAQSDTNAEFLSRWLFEDPPLHTSHNALALCYTQSRRRRVHND